MKVKQMYPSKYLRGEDLPGPVTVTISGVRNETYYRPGEGQINGFVLFCENATKAVLLNKTLAESIARALQDDETDNWRGKQVVLYPEKIKVGGVDRMAIRARAVDNQRGDI